MELVKLRLFILFFAGTLLCTACAPSKIRGNPPFISISSLSIAQQSLDAHFDIRNINEVDMTVDGVDITISVRGAELTRYDGPYELSLGPNATEQISLDSLPDGLARDKLGELEQGGIASLPFTLVGRVHTTEDGYLSFEHEGHLYPIPGKPGQFRSATSRSR